MGIDDGLWLELVHHCAVNSKTLQFRPQAFMLAIPVDSIVGQLINDPSSRHLARKKPSISHDAAKGLPVMVNGESKKIEHYLSTTWSAKLTRFDLTWTGKID